MYYHKSSTSQTSHYRTDTLGRLLKSREVYLHIMASANVKLVSVMLYTSVVIFSQTFFADQHTDRPKPHAQKTDISNLPPELIIAILSYLEDPLDLSCLLRVSEKVQEVYIANKT